MPQNTCEATGTNATAQDRAPDERLKVGCKVIISHLAHAVELNGKVATILFAENDEGKVVVEHEERILRLKRAHLIALDTFEFDEKDYERPQ